MPGQPAHHTKVPFQDMQNKSLKQTFIKIDLHGFQQKSEGLKTQTEKQANSQ